eukprot:jgi/Tetstr1/462204/TSEL_007267.t1
MKTCYRRTAFQSPASNKIRFTVDEDIYMVNETEHANSSIASLAAEDVTADRLENFPYGVLEVKLEADGNQDAAMRDLCALLPMDSLLKVPKFSKFLHGTAALLARDQRIEKLPAWFVDDLADPTQRNHRPCTYMELAEQMSSGNSQINSGDLPLVSSSPSLGDQLQTPSCPSGRSHEAVSGQTATTLGKGAASSPGGSGDHTVVAVWKQYICRSRGEKRDQPPIKDASTIIAPNKPSGSKGEPPRTFFSNERTFLSWLSIAVLLLFAGLSLMDGASFSSLSTPMPVRQAPGLGNPAGNNGTDGTGSNADRFMSHKITGIVIVPVSLVFMVYALLQYRHRAYKLMKREAIRYDDQIGPIMLVLFLLFASIAAFSLSLHSMSLV